MEAEDGAAAPALNRLAREIRQYSLCQGIERALALLANAEPSLSEEGLYERLEFCANPGYGFAGQDIDQLVFFSEHGELRAQIRINVLGLSGAGSPLPDFYPAQALGESGGNIATRQVLDLLGDRVQRLLWPIWRKYRYFAGFRPGASDRFSERVFALIGLGPARLRATRELDWKRLLPYLGLLSMRAHSAALIEAVLRYYFNHPQICIEQAVERKVSLDPAYRCRLASQGCLLGVSAVIGERVPDRSGKFRIHISALTWDRFHEFLPTGPGRLPLAALVRFTLRDPLDHDVCLRMDGPEIRELRLAADTPCRLGWTTWLCHEHADGIATLGGAPSKDPSS